jgi:hypothetical protein
MTPAGGRLAEQLRAMERNTESSKFIGRIELANAFKTKPKVVEATISFILVGRTPKFLKIEVDGENLPVRQASESSLLKAYLHRRPCAI